MKNKFTVRCYSAGDVANGDGDLMPNGDMMWEFTEADLAELLNFAGEEHYHMMEVITPEETRTLKRDATGDWQEITA